MMSKCGKSYNRPYETPRGPGAQGSAFGLTQGAGSLARTVGPVITGGLYAAVGFWSPFVLGAAVLVPVGLLVLRIGSPTEPPEPRPVDPGHVR